MLTDLVRRLVRGRQPAAAHDAGTAAQLITQAIASIDAGDAESSIELLERALRLGGENVEALTALGAAYRALDEPARAFEYFQRALDAPGAAPRTARLRNCAIQLQELGEAARAQPFCEEAAALAPDDAEIQVDLALLSFDSADFDAARARLSHALLLDPASARAHLALAVDRLAEGDYANGWLQYEWRFSAGRYQGRKPNPGRRWTRETRSGAVCVTWEQGLGDQIMYASCIADLIACTARCVLECDERLVGLFRRSFPQATVVAATVAERTFPGSTLDECEWEIPMGSLPGTFRREPAQFPRPARPYLRADPSRVAYWRERLRALGHRPAIGLSWRGGLPHSRRPVRSIEPETFGGVLRSEDAIWISLQYGEVDTDIARIAAATGRRIHHWPEVIADYDETAALVTALDLVVSVCTSIVHLAGALGATAWVLVPQVPEWRYGRRGDRMIWYDGVRLFRQPTLGDWQTTVARISDALAARASRVALHDRNEH